MVFEGLTAPAGVQAERQIPLVSMPFKRFTHTPPPPPKRNVLGGPLGPPVVIDENAQREFAAGQLALSTQRTPGPISDGAYAPGTKVVASEAMLAFWERKEAEATR